MRLQVNDASVIARIAVPIPTLVVRAFAIVCGQVRTVSNGRNTLLIVAIIVPDLLQVLADLQQRSYQRRHQRYRQVQRSHPAPPGYLADDNPNRQNHKPNPQTP